MAILKEKIILLSFLFLLSLTPSLCWDNEELEMFDLVEEVDQNFYEVMGISSKADLTEIKKAYRSLSKQIHPDKNDAEDAEVKFRQLVGIYEVLRDEKRREQYERVLVEGLPDWRSPVFYFRRVRKMSMWEVAFMLTLVVSLSQYLMAWGSYLEKRYSMSEYLEKKYKPKDRKKKKGDDGETIVEEYLAKIPRPSWKNILPIQIVMLCIFLVKDGPTLVRTMHAEMKQRKEDEKRKKEEEEENERQAQKEEEERAAKKAQRRGRQRVVKLPDRTGEIDSERTLENGEKGAAAAAASEAAAPACTGGMWTDEDFAELARLMAKFPGGIPQRWEKIAERMRRTVYEVTKMSNKIKNRMQNPPSLDATVEAVKTKVKTKGDAVAGANKGSDEFWSAGEQAALEKALKQYPKGVDARWDRIARCVPDKAKEDCMLRFKFLAERVKKKKEEQQQQQQQQINGDSNAVVEEPQETSTPPHDEEEEEVEAVPKKSTGRVGKKSKRRRKRDNWSSEDEEEDYVQEDEDEHCTIETEE